MRKKWQCFYRDTKEEMLQVVGNSNLPYLLLLQKHTSQLQDWILRSHINHYQASFQSYSLQKFVMMEMPLYHLNFDWCSISEEVYGYLREEPSSFEIFASTIYYLFDFLLSYNSLIECPQYPNNQLYYTKLAEEVIYECKFPPLLYDLDFNSIHTTVETAYCPVKILQEKGFYRE